MGDELISVPSLLASTSWLPLWAQMKSGQAGDERWCQGGGLCPRVIQQGFVALSATLLAGEGPESPRASLGGSGCRVLLPLDPTPKAGTLCPALG